MKVYTAERHIDYEGFTLLGIFTTRAKAQVAIDNDNFDGIMRGDSHEIEVYEVE